MTDTDRCEPPNELRERIARAIHEGLGPNWAYCNYGGDEWNSCRYMLDDAADKVLAIVTPPSTVAALVEALEECANDLEQEVRERHPPYMAGYPEQARKLVRDLEPVMRARAALALYRGEAGR